jgi:hypothetical protein
MAPLHVLEIRMKLSAALVLGLFATLSLVSFGVLATPVAALVSNDDCPDASGDFNFAVLATAEPALQTSYTQSGNTFTFSVTTPSGPSGQGVIEYCVFPTDASGDPTGTIPTGTTWNIPPPPLSCTPPGDWETSSGGGYVSGVRVHGTDVIPYDGSTTCALNVVWGSSVGHFQIILHVLDSTLCGGTSSNPNTCYVIPNGSPIFPPPPPPPGVPQFPLGVLLVVAIAIPALLLVKKRQLVI